MTEQEQALLDSMEQGSPAYNALYRKLNQTFRSQYDAFVYGNWGLREGARHRVTQEAKLDQRMIQTMKARLGNCAVFYVGDPKALYQKYYVRLDPSDYCRTAKLIGDDLWIPDAFAKKLLGECLSVKDGYVNLSAYCHERQDVSLYHYEDSLLYVFVPSTEAPFSELIKTYPDIDIRVDAVYTERQFLDRLVCFFTHPIFPEDVVCDAEQTRSVIAHYSYPTDLTDFMGHPFLDVASPSIVMTKENGKRIYWASHEKTVIIKCVPNQPEESKTETLLWRRAEDEDKWTCMGSVDEMRWGSVFEANGKIYLLGSVRWKFDIQIAELQPNGGFKTAIIVPSASGCGANGPNAILHSNGRIYKAYNKKIISAPADADLLNPDSWTVSQHIQEIITMSWLKDQTGVSDFNYLCIEEGEMLKKGSDLYVMYRLNHELAPLNHAVLAKVYWEGENLKLKEPQYIDIPTTLTKIGVKYDAVSDRYCALTSTKFVSHDSARMNIALLHSKDLVNWSNAGNILVEREMMNEELSAQAHGYNYADLIIDGEDIHFVLREASGDDAQWWHEGNFFTFYTVRDFRSLIK